MRYKLVTSIAENRLILLYLVSKLPLGMDHDHIVRFNQEREWMLYFDMEQFLAELKEDGLLAVRQMDDRRVYTLTVDGLNVLNLLKNRIALNVRNTIDERVAELKDELELDLEVTATYGQTAAGEYPVKLRLTEDLATLLELNLTAPSAEIAEGVCRRFRQEATVLYAQILARLTRDEYEETEETTL